jgi:ABC-type transporter Mla subunit MlaD
MAEITIRVSDRALRTAGVLFGGLILASLSLYLWSSGVFAPKYTLHVYVPEASGLVVHAPVRITGVQVGSVKIIKPAEELANPERKVELVLRVDKRYQDEIRSDSAATIDTEGLRGNRYLSIRRGFHGSVINAGGEVQFVPAREMTPNAIKTMMDCLQAGKNSADNKSQAPPPAPSKP